MSEKTCGCGKSESGACDGSHGRDRVCVVCGHVHDPKTEGNWWELPADFVCPECGVGKDEYELI
jgi:rubredoxin